MGSKSDEISELNLEGIFKKFTLVILLLFLTTLFLQLHGYGILHFISGDNVVWFLILNNVIMIIVCLILLYRYMKEDEIILSFIKDMLILGGFFITFEQISVILIWNQEVNDPVKFPLWIYIPIICGILIFGARVLITYISMAIKERRVKRDNDKNSGN